MKNCICGALLCVFLATTLWADDDVVVIEGTQTILRGDVIITGNLTVQGQLIVNGKLIVNGNSTADEDPTDDPGDTATDIYVELWNLDQQHNGLSVSLSGAADADVHLQEQDEAAGNDDQALDPLIVVHQSDKLDALVYQTVRPLFDNYTMTDREAENVTDAEKAEVDKFLDAVVNTEVMQRCLTYLNDNSLVANDPEVTTAELKELLKLQWFDLFTNNFNGNSNPQVSGFEHVFVGDKNGGGGIGGHHFWYKFFLDQTNSAADSRGHNYGSLPGETYPVLATFSMTWSPDGQTISSDRKGFLVGCSPDLMLAYGTIALLEEPTKGHPKITLEGGRFELVLHAETPLDSSQPADQIRSVFPKLESVGPPPPTPDTISVAIALSVPEGQDFSVRGKITARVNGKFGLQLSDIADLSKSLAVKLPPEFRDQFSPLLKPSVLGTTVIVVGKRSKYTGIAGVIDVSQITTD
jgi:hypothetical protein